MDARPEHIKVMKQIHPHLKSAVVDLESDWPFEEGFDLILHLGLMYHLDDIHFSLRKSIESAKNVVLETEVCDSSDPQFILKIEEDCFSYDQSFSGVGTRPSGAYIEQAIKELGADFEMLRTNECNALYHVYDWKIGDSLDWCHGLRRMWFIEK